MPDIRFWATSGSEHMQLFAETDTLENIGYEIQNLDLGAGANDVKRIGFFGDAGPGSPVVVNTYQSKTYPTDAGGDADTPPLVQLKYPGGSLTGQVQVSGAWIASTEEVGFTSGTVMMRFTEPTSTAVQTQNAFVECLKLNENENAAPDEAPSNIVVRAFECQHPDGLSITNSVWIQLSGAGANGDGTANNKLSLTDQPQVTPIHDWCIALSASPTAAGTNIAFGFLVFIEYL